MCVGCSLQVTGAQQIECDLGAQGSVTVEHEAGDCCRRRASVCVKPRASARSTWNYEQTAW